MKVFVKKEDYDRLISGVSETIVVSPVADIVCESTGRIKRCPVLDVSHPDSKGAVVLRVQVIV